MKYTGELTVITKAKDLCSYILTVTQKSPKKFRFSLVGRLQNYSLSIIENLIMANEIFVDSQQGSNREAVKERRDKQYEAMTYLKLLSYMSQMSMEQLCITRKQYEQISKKIYDVQNLLGAWINSDRKRYKC